MPRSKSKRKKTGGFIARQRDAKIVRTGKAADKDAYVRAWRRVEAERAKMVRFAGLMEMRLSFVDDEELGTAFIRAQLSLRRLAEDAARFSQEDWKAVASSLMLGAKVYRHFKEAGFELDDGVIRELRHGAWILACTGRLINEGRAKDIPSANVEVIHEALDLAQALLKDARLLDQEALARIVIGNFKVVPDEDLRFLLGEHVEQIFQWEKEQLEEREK